MDHRATARDLRRRTRAAVLRHIVLTGETTRAQIGQRCRLSQATVANVVSDLIHEGLVEERGTLPSEGRPIGRIRAATDGPCLIGVDVSEQGVTADLFDLTLHRIDRVSQQLHPGEAGPKTVAEALQEAVERIRTANRERWSHLVGIGLGLPGIVETAADGTTTFYAQNLGWLPARLEDICPDNGVPVFADNGIRTLTAAEMWLGAAVGVQHGIVMFVGHGISVGIISSGQLLRGTAGSAGEFGHTKIALGRRRCQCGQYGCFQAHVGGEAILDRWDGRLRSDRGPEEPDGPAEEARLSEFLAAAEAGDKKARRVLDDVTRTLALGIANLVNLFNPEQVLLGGWVGTKLLEARPADLESYVRQFALVRPGQEVRLGGCQLGKDAVAIGAALLPLERLIESNLRSPEVAH